MKLHITRGRKIGREFFFLIFIREQHEDSIKQIIIIKKIFHINLTKKKKKNKKQKTKTTTTTKETQLQLNLWNPCRYHGFLVFTGDTLYAIGMCGRLKPLLTIHCFDPRSECRPWSPLRPPTKVTDANAC